MTPRFSVVVEQRFLPFRATRQRLTASATVTGGVEEIMYHYDPTTALEELNEDAVLPNPVRVRDMMLRAHLDADHSLEYNRLFVEYQKRFGELQKLGRQLLERLGENT
ncbi:MAG TPA: hypothetical protein VKG65_08860 [Terriglobales bacterium]|nr:hypothetical protein [Terriglobales bacterium]